jgi:Plavaka transposase
MWYIALPCDTDGDIILPSTPPPARQPLDAVPDNTFHPFDDRLAFEFADYHFSRQKSSESSINDALQLWAAGLAKHGHDDIYWRSATEMYYAIDQIKQGDNPWKVVSFHYQGSMPEIPPKWMTETYTLVTRDILCLLREQIACTDFDGHWDYVPFMEFNSAGKRIWTNIMSGDWAAKQAVRILFIYSSVTSIDRSVE